MKKYYFVGIKGSGMSSLAQILKDKGHFVIGSDIEEYVFTQDTLIKKGIEILSFDKNNINNKGFTYVVGNAFNEENNVEVKRLTELGIKYDRYHDIVKELSTIGTTIGVSGIHGKTSTVSLLSYLMDRTVGTNYLIGDGKGKGNKNSKYFVFEACEYKNTFLHYQPSYGIITNLGFDHPDFFKNEQQVIGSFSEYVKNIKKQVLIYGDDGKYKQLRIREFDNIITYGFNKTNHFYCENIVQDENGCSYDLFEKGKFITTVKTPTFGSHSILNSMAAVSIMYLEKIDLGKVNEILNTYEGASRRFSLGDKNGYTWISDYAHHPNEIESIYDAVKQKFPNKQITAIFQPHTFSRTMRFEKDYKKVLSKFDYVYGCEIFSSAREKEQDYTIRDLLKGLKHSEILKLTEIEVLKKHKDTILLFMGAGDIEKYIREFKKCI